MGGSLRERGGPDSVIKAYEILLGVGAAAKRCFAGR